MSPSSSPTSRATPAPLLFALSLLALSTFFLLGNLGAFNDDYFYVQRDVRTDAIRALILDRPYHAWRPAYKLIVPPLMTLLWNHLWVFHLLCTLTHGAVVFLFFRFLRALHLSLPVSAAAALLFLVSPAQHEALFWLCDMPTPLATGLLLWLARRHLLWIRRDPALPLPLHARLTPFLLAAVAFLIAALNEQPAGPIASLIGFGFIVQPSPAIPARLIARRTLIPLSLCGGSLLIYIIGHFQNSPRAQRAFTTTDDLAERTTTNLLRLPGEILEQLALRDFGMGALTHGLQVLADHPWRAALFLIALALTAPLWIIAPAPRIAPGSSSPDAFPRPPLLRIALFGLLFCFTAWLPVAIIHARVAPRLHYVPTLGLLITLSAIVQALAPRLPALRSLAPLARALFSFILITFAIMLVGVQNAYRLRHQQDQREAATLASLASAVEPGTLFIPWVVHSDILHTGSTRFDRDLHPCWTWWYAAGHNLQQNFKRDDIHTVLSPRDARFELWSWRDNPARFALFRGRLVRPTPDRPMVHFPISPDGQGRLLPWDRAVVFRIDNPPDPIISLYTRIELVDESGQLTASFTPRQIARIQAARSTPLPDLPLQLTPLPIAERRPPAP